MNTFFNQNWIKKAKEDGMHWGWLLEDSAITKLHTLQNQPTIQSMPTVKQEITDIKQQIETQTHDDNKTEQTVTQAQNVAKEIEHTNVDTSVLNDATALKENMPVTVEKTVNDVVKEVTIDTGDSPSNNVDDEKLEVLETDDGTNASDDGLNVILPSDTPEIVESKHKQSLSVSKPISELISNDTETENAVGSVDNDKPETQTDFVILDNDNPDSVDINPDSVDTISQSPSSPQTVVESENVDNEPQTEHKHNPIPKSKAWKDKMTKQQKKLIPPTPPPDSQPKHQTESENVHAFDVQPATPSVEPINDDATTTEPLTHEQKWDITNDNVAEDVDIAFDPQFISDDTNHDNVKTISVFPNNPTKTKAINPELAAEYRLAFLTDKFDKGSGVYEIYNQDKNKYENVYVDVVSPKKHQVFHHDLLKKHDDMEQQDGDIFINFKSNLANKAQQVKSFGSSIAKMMKIIPN